MQYGNRKESNVREHRLRSGAVGGLNSSNSTDTAERPHDEADKGHEVREVHGTNLDHNHGAEQIIGAAGTHESSNFTPKEHRGNDHGR